MDTTESNKLIAEFMGFTQEKNLGWYDNEMNLEQIVYDVQNGNCFDELLFDRDWNWLLPVLKKSRGVNIDDSDWTDQVYDGLLDIDIDFLYEGIVEFVKWYNENK